MKTICINDYHSLHSLFEAINPNYSKVITIITGDPGHGKTSLMVAFGLVNMNLRLLPEYKQACNKIDYLNAHKRVNFPYPPEKHLVFSTDVEVTKFSPKMKSYDFNSWRTGMNDPRYTTQYFPQNTLRLWDEIQKSFPSQQDQENSKIPLRVSTEFQKARHYNIYTVGTAQVGTDIHKKLRDISSFIISKKVKRVRNKQGVVTHTMWDTLYCVKKFNYDAWVDSKGDESSCESVRFIYKGDIGRHYDHKSCEKEFDEVDNKFCSYDQTYEEPNSLAPPPGYSKLEKQTKGAKQQNEQKD